MSNTIIKDMPDIGTQRRIADYFGDAKEKAFKAAEKLAVLTDADKVALATLIQQGNARALEIAARFNCFSSHSTAEVDCG